MPTGQNNAARLDVALGDRSYPILIGPDLLAEGVPDDWLVGSEVFVISNETVAPLLLQRLEAALDVSGSAVGSAVGNATGSATGTTSRPQRRVDTLILPDGERYKTLASLEQVIDALLARRHSRHTTLIALGGGVIGDLTGFAAACYQRGVAFVQIPTTLLAQVDSSIGGKTAVNHPRGKNMIGAFHQPRGVLIDTSVLVTLPDRELAAGLAEVVKYGCIRDAAFLAWLEDAMPALLRRDPATLVHAIRRSCELKAEVVALDEREAGLRAILNFGHTFGHAIETHTGYASWLHGEAVGAGMVMAADLSWRLGRIGLAAAQRIRAVVAAAGLPIVPPADLSVDGFLGHMAVDKKVIDGRLRLVLLDAPGHASVVEDVEPSALRATLAAGDALCGGGR